MMMFGGASIKFAGNEDEGDGRMSEAEKEATAMWSPNLLEKRSLREEAIVLERNE